MVKLTRAQQEALDLLRKNGILTYSRLAQVIYEHRCPNGAAWTRLGGDRRRSAPTARPGREEAHRVPASARLR